MPALAEQTQATVDVPAWLPDKAQGGWGGNHNSTLEKDPQGLILKAGHESYYGSAFRGLGAIDLDQCPFFVVEVDLAQGAFGCKLINEAKRDKQVIFKATPGDRCCMTYLPAQTGWKGKARLTIGIYCHGEDTSLRVKSIQFVARPSKELMDRYDQVRNLLFNSSFEMDKPGKPAMQTWHRLGNYLRYETPWRIVREGAFHKNQCARTAKPGKLIVQREIHSPAARVYTFSAHLKASRASHRARLAVTLYRQGRPFRTRTESEDIVVGKDWARYHMTIDVPVVRNRVYLGPTDIAIESLDDGELLVDALQLEVAKVPTMYGLNRRLLIYKRAANLRSPLYKPVTDPPAPASMPKRPTAAIPLSPLDGQPPPAKGWPMSGMVTLPQGQSYDIRTWRFRNDDGTCLPTQSRVLARWKRDGSIKAAQVAARADGSKQWTLEYNSTAPAPTAVSEAERLGVKIPDESRSPRSLPRTFIVTSLDGREFANEDKPLSMRMEERGPIRTVVRAEGAHRSDTGEPLLSYVTRASGWPQTGFSRLEYTWVNTNASPSVVVSSIAARMALDRSRTKAAVFFGPNGRAHEVNLAAPASILQCNERGKYFYEIRQGDGEPQRFEGKAEGRVRLDLGDHVLDVLVEDWWQNHPMEIAVDRNNLTIYFWSPRVKAVELTRGVAKTYIVNSWSGPKSKAPERMGGPAILVPATSVHCRSGLFGGAILPSAGSPFTIFENAVNSRACRARMDPEVMLATDSYGQFNYGDCMGDGGWANLETQRGHAAWFHYLRTGDPRMFAVAQAAARHYRDIDIDQLSGGTYTHNPSHTLGGKSASHAWIQSMLDHYLVTGERRSMEVALLHADYLRNMPPRKLARGGRTVTRILDNMADLYMVTGDDELVERYHQIAAAQRENVVAGKSRFPGVFQQERYGQWTYPAGFPPWYGLYSQVKMRLATGDPSWEKALAEELGYAMAKLPYKYAWPDYFQGNDLTDDQRIVRCLAEGAIGDRGCMLFPALGYGYRWTRDRRYLDIGMATVYIAIISREFQDPLYALAAVFLEQAREAGLGADDEKRCYQQAIDIMKRAARPALSNPGFEEGRKDWRAWSVKSATSSFWVPVRDKCLLPDTQTRKEGKQSLHVILRRKCPPWGSSVPLDSEYFVLDKGRKYTIEGWVRTRNDVNASVYLSVRPLSAEVEPQGFRGAVAKPGPDGWRRWKVEAIAEVDSLARLRLTIGRPHAKAEGDAWWDGIEVEQE